MIVMTCACGHVGRYKTPELATFHFGRHSCDKHLADRARAARVVARQTADGPRRDCTHPNAQHQHGTSTAYVLDRCRCRACRDANTARSGERTRQQAYGRWNGLVDAQPARDHLLRLSAQGMGWKRAARQVSVATGTVYAILWGKIPDNPDHPEHRPPRRRIRPDVAAKLLAARLDLAGGSLTESTGTTRRLRALVARGWTMTELGRRLGWTPANMARNITEPPGSVRATTERAVHELYRQLWNVTPAPSAQATRARKLAAARGWAPPMAWDDDTIDDPAATPDDGTTAARTAADRLDDIEWLLDQGVTPHEIAGRQGIALPALLKLCDRQCRPDLRRRLARREDRAA